MQNKEKWKKKVSNTWNKNVRKQRKNERREIKEKEQNIPVEKCRKKKKKNIK